MKKLLILLCFIFIASCTFRSYDVNFNYYVANGKNIESYEEYKKQIAEAEGTITENKEGIVYIPEGSGNFTIYIQAEVPKQIEVAAEAELTPFSGSILGP